jgi:hypothetical protein
MILVLKKINTHPEQPTCNTTITQGMARKGYTNRSRRRRRRNYNIKTTNGQMFKINYYRCVFIP